MTAEEKEKAKKLLSELKQAGCRQDKEEFQRLKRELAETLLLVDPKKPKAEK